MKKILILICAALIGLPEIVRASSGCAYPSSHDVWANKLAGDFLTVTDVNQFRCAIEKLESGPLRPNKGGVPYGFLGDGDTGMDSATTDQIDFLTGGVSRLVLTAFGRLSLTSTSSDVGFFVSHPASTLAQHFQAFNTINSRHIIMRAGAHADGEYNAMTASGDNQIIYDAGSANTGALVLIQNGNLGRGMRIQEDGSVTIGHRVSTGSSGGDMVLTNDNSYRFLNAAGTTSADFHVHGNSSNHMVFGVPTAANVFSWAFAGTSRFQVVEQNAGAGLLFLQESSNDHSNPAANQAVIYLRDNGGGKSELMARFGTGIPVLIAVEP